MKRYYIIAFGIFFIFFAFLQFFTSHLIGADSYYHVAVSEIVRKAHSIEPFWFTESILEHVDIHWLFHILLVPFTVFHPIIGAKLAIILFAALTFTLILWYLKKQNIPSPEMWILFILAGSYILLFRLTAVRVYMLSLAMLILAAYFFSKNNFKALAIIAFFYAWLYSGFPLLIVFALCYLLADYFLRKEFQYKPLVAVTTGSLLGLLINPFFPNILKVYYVQVFGGFVFPPLTDLPMEALPFPSITIFLAACWFTLAVLIFTLLTIGKKKVVFTKESVAWLLMSLFFLFFTYQSRRFVEYWIPFTTIACAFLIRDNNVDFGEKKGVLPKKLVFIIPITILILFFAVYQTNENISYELNEQRLQDYGSCILALRQHAQSNDLVFVSWSKVPVFLLGNPNLNYINALDPVFLYAKSPELYNKYQSVINGTSVTPYKTIKEDFKANWVVVDKNNRDFALLIDGNKGFPLVFQSEVCAVFQVL